MRTTEPWSGGEGLAGTNTPTALLLLPGPCHVMPVAKSKQKVETEDALMQPIQVRLWAQSRAGAVGLGPNRQGHPAQVVSFWFLSRCEPSTQPLNLPASVSSSGGWGRPWFQHWSFVGRIDSETGNHGAVSLCPGHSEKAIVRGIQGSALTIELMPGPLLPHAHLK